MAETSTTTHIDRLGRVIIGVTDQDAALAFYTEKLGFEVRADIPYGDGARWLEVAPPGGDAAIAIVTPPQDSESSAGGADTGVALTTKDIDAAHAELRDRGVDVDDVMRMGEPVPPMFWFRDQDQNRLLLVEE